MLLTLALRNIFRQIVRTGMTLAAIAFGVAGLIMAGGFVQDIFAQLGEAVIQSRTGHVQVFRTGFIEQGVRQPEKYLIDAPHVIAERIASLEGVERVSARLNFSGLLNNGRRDLAIIGEGIEPDKEAQLSTYLRILEGRQLTDDDVFGILLGQGVAQAMGVGPGDVVTVVLSTTDGALNTLDFDVVGVFQSFSRDFDARAVRIPLAAAQELMLTDGANLLVISLDDTQRTDSALLAISGQLGGTGLDARSWRDLDDFYDKAVSLYERQFGVLQLIILFMVLMSVANSVNMSTFERMSEFGTLGAMGNRRKHIFRLVVIENTILGVVGATLGVLIGITLAVAISAIGIPMPPPPNSNAAYTAYIRIVPATVLMAFAVGCVATTLAALNPARRVSRIPIVDALRQGS